jgi:MFS family permease
MIEKIFPNIPRKWRGVLAITASTLLHFAMALFYLWSTINIYVVSYFRLHSDESLNISFGVIFLPFYTLSLSISGLFSNAFVEKLGVNWAFFLSGVGTSLCTFSASFVNNIYAFMVIFAIFQGISLGLIMILPFYCCFGFFPHNRGLVNGILQTGFGIGGVIYNTLALNVSNPENIVPSIISTSGDKYFDSEVNIYLFI